MGNRGLEVGTCQPLEPAANQVQVRVSYCGICGTDLHIYFGDLDVRVQPPRIIGHEMIGFVEKTGSAVEGYKPGDLVTVRPLITCGECDACKRGHNHVCKKLCVIGVDAPGAMQSFWTVPADTLHRVPTSLSLEEAALTEPIAVACHDVRLGNVQAGHNVAVLGCGPIGLLIALVARDKGAHVILSEPSEIRRKVAEGMGLKCVHPSELEKAVDEMTNGVLCDVVFEVSGAGPAAAAMTKVTRTRGMIVIVSIFAKPPVVDLKEFFARELQMCGARVYEPRDFEEAIALAASGRLPLKQVITSVLPLEQVNEAFQAAESGAAMKVLLRIQS